MSKTRYKIYNTQYPYFITSSIVDGYPLFSNPLAAEILLAALTFLQDQRNAEVYAYVIMENHTHLIARSTKLPKHLRAFKSWTARQIINKFSENAHTLQLSKLRMAKKPNHSDSEYQVWKEDYFPKQIIGDDMMIQKIEYIHDNPVKRGFVDHPEHWRYSSARNYLGMKALIPITLFGR